jgi:hypothetical protein
MPIEYEEEFYFREKCDDDDEEVFDGYFDLEEGC